MNTVLPDAWKKYSLKKYRCDTCGNRACRKRLRAVCFIHCGDWKPELLPLDRLMEERRDIHG